MKIGQSNALKPKVFVGHSNGTPYDIFATAAAAKDRGLASTTSSPYGLNKQSNGQESQQSYEIVGTAIDIKDPHGYHVQALNPPKDDCQGRFYDTRYLASGLYPAREAHMETTEVELLHDGDGLQQRTASSTRGKYSEDIGTMESKPALLPKDNSQEQLCKEGHQKYSTFSDDKVKDKTSNSKRRADDTKAPHKRSRTSVTTDTDKRLETFACPYYRKEPERYLDCLNLKMLRISDVKQHLKRRHTFNYSCTRCFEGFLSSNTYEEHVLLKSCPITECNNNYGLSPVAQQALKDRVDRSSSPERQWHEISRILFGKLGLSLNPYQDGVFKEITGIIRGIWKSEEQGIISSLRETQNVPCATQLRPLLFEILAKVEDCFEQKEKKSPERNPAERSESIEYTATKLRDEGKSEHDCKPPGFSTIKNNNGSYNPMQDWPYSASLDTSNSIFNYSMLPDYQNQQVGCPFMNLSVHHPEDEINWHSIGPNSITSMENVVAHQVSMENFAFTEDDLHSAQMPDMFD
ncbi:uncharacterized protein FPRO_11619 [Fusarium proliferatum ET1]|uniref:C2H2-type domain-containing protein n=1 Tax=Fusarium proliferatum (strain ET1) TaxID=1227346 RepID=A0A1L7W164_FUSPR|nr:uncharacterized protein FPRO_11619 [Fusarium proliferatum ET1]CZR46172.1 uncharacterized protein FPRO_11619 [Fusarium proliferatum ET1]